MKAHPKSLARYFQFLDQLRESGVTNMYGATPYLMQTFKMKREAAAEVLIAWMKSFSREKSATERASDWLTKARGVAP